MDPDKWKSVAVSKKTWSRLMELSEDSERSIGGEISFLAKHEYLSKKMDRKYSIDKEKAEA